MTEAKASNHSLTETNETTARTCTNCGQTVENSPYQYWLFKTCESCAAEPSPDRWGNERTIGVGTYRKWRYFPRWHMTEHPNAETHWRTNEIEADKQ